MTALLETKYLLWETSRSGILILSRGFFIAVLHSASKSRSIGTNHRLLHVPPCQKTKTHFIIIYFLKNIIIIISFLKIILLKWIWDMFNMITSRDVSLGAKKSM